MSRTAQCRDCGKAVAANRDKPKDFQPLCHDCRRQGKGLGMKQWYDCANCGKRFIRYYRAHHEPVKKYCDHKCQGADMRTRPVGQPRAAFRRSPAIKAAARGYGAKHQAERKRRLAALRDGDPCCRCGQPMWRIQAPSLHLDHNDQDRTKYRGLAHGDCNRNAGAKLGYLKSRQTSTRRCVHCGRTFHPWTPDQTRCSHACRTAMDNPPPRARGGKPTCPTCGAPSFSRAQRRCLACCTRDAQRRRTG
jgi:hypothetical protein